MSVSIRSEGDVLALAAEQRGAGAVVADVIVAREWRANLAPEAPAPDR